MTRKQGQLTAYFAGLFDGEGSVGIYRMGGTYKLSAIVNMDNPTAVALLKREFPEAVFSKRRRDVGHDYYRVAFNHYKAYEFLKVIEPFVLVKRSQVKLGLAFLAHRRRERVKSRVHKNPCSRCESLTAKIKNLKQVKSVNLHDLREYRAKPEEVEADKRLIRELLEGVETRLSESNKAVSACEKDIVQAAS